MAKPTRWEDCTPGSNAVEERPWKSLAYFPEENGRSHHRASCPFCNTMMTVYVWSLRGGGKRCPNPDCRAMLGSHGGAFKLIDDSATTQGTTP